MSNPNVRLAPTKGSVVLLAMVVTAFLSGCEQEIPEVAERIRAIKTITVVEVASGQLRKYSGVVAAADSSALSFQVNGNVSAVNVEAGEKVTKGQLLAALDPKPYELDVKAAEAELGKANASRQAAKQELDRFKQLFEKSWVSKQDYDRVVRNAEASAGESNFAISKLELAKRNLTLTNLTAPFDGVISERLVDSFVEVRAGQKVFQIEAAGGLEVQLEIPETVINRVTHGMPVTVRFPTEKNTIGEGRITEIGSTATAANAFSVKASLANVPAGIRSGMTAEISILLAGDQTETAYLVPMSAVAPTDDPEKNGSVFVFDPETGTVTRRPVRAAGVTDNTVHIFEGVKIGDVIAVAGVSFLRDGQRVKLLQP